MFETELSGKVKEVAACRCSKENKNVGNFPGKDPKFSSL